MNHSFCTRSPQVLQVLAVVLLAFLYTSTADASSSLIIQTSEQSQFSAVPDHSEYAPKYSDTTNSSESDSLKELLPTSAQLAETLPHFPNRTAAFVWRNWNLVPLKDMARTLKTRPENIQLYATRMGLPPYANQIWSPDSVYITVLRRNWSLLPYEQLLTLLRLNGEELAKRLREDDFLFVKLGAKPLCAPLIFEEPSEDVLRALNEIADEVADVFTSSNYVNREPLFAFMQEFDDQTPDLPRTDAEAPGGTSISRDSTFKLCYLHSYFALFGDPLLQDSSKIYPDELLRKLAARGVSGVWLHSLLRDLAPPSPIFPEFGDKSEIRRANLRNLVNRAKTYGIDVYLYMNEPRAMPTTFFDAHEEERGIAEGAYSAMCASSPKVRQWLSDALAGLFADTPGLGGIFTITGSENLTSCVSHGKFAQCPRCSLHTDVELLVDLNAAMEEGVHRSAPDAKVIVWDWGWRGHGLATDVIERLPKNVWLQSVSEWALPIERGGVPVTIGEYSISAVGPGPRALAHWEAARKAGLKTIAKCQFNTTWEIGSIPSVPALDLVARHASNLTSVGIDGVMASWSLGGFPSMNLELVNEIASSPEKSVDDVLDSLATKYFGNEGRSQARKGWSLVSAAFEEFPFSGAVVYNAPNQIGPANLLRLEPTGWRASMVGIPYDDVDSWRSPYPPEIFASQMEKCGRGFLKGAEALKSAAQSAPAECARDAERQGIYAEFAGAVFLSVANQTRFIELRNERIALRKELVTHALSTEQASRLAAVEEEMILLAEDEIELARRALDASLKDSCIGFESTNQYWFVPNDLAEKILSCRDIVRRIKSGL
jgi:hypothetical protein